jgi:hypothetical protein
MAGSTSKKYVLPPLERFQILHAAYSLCLYGNISLYESPKRTPALSDVADSNGGKCLMHLTLITMEELIPTNWVRRWPTTSTLAPVFVVLSSHPRPLLQSPCRHKHP